VAEAVGGPVAEGEGVSAEGENEKRRAGEKLAVIGIEPAGKSGGYIARLRRLQIVAETRLSRDFWNLNASDRARILEGFRRAGASGVITSDQPYTPPAPWVRLGQSDYYFYRFTEVP
jgi:hypothetical protein